MREVTEDEKLEIQTAFENWLEVSDQFLGGASIAFFEGAVSPRVYFIEQNNELVVQSRNHDGVLIQCVLDFKTAVKLHGIVDLLLVTMSKPREENQP